VVQRREQAKSAHPGARSSTKKALSERRIKTLLLSHYSPKTWRENLAKVLIPKDRPWEGGYHHYQSVNTPRTKKPKKILPANPPPKIYFQGKQTENSLSDFPET
jgi:hypothetical protein